MIARRESLWLTSHHCLYHLLTDSASTTCAEKYLSQKYIILTWWWTGGRGQRCDGPVVKSYWLVMLAYMKVFTLWRRCWKGQIPEFVCWMKRSSGLFIMLRNICLVWSSWDEVMRWRWFCTDIAEMIEMKHCLTWYKHLFSTCISPVSCSGMYICLYDLFSSSSREVPGFDDSAFTVQQIKIITSS